MWGVFFLHNGEIYSDFLPDTCVQQCRLNVKCMDLNLDCPFPLRSISANRPDEFKNITNDEDGNNQIKQLKVFASCNKMNADV